MKNLLLNMPLLQPIPIKTRGKPWYKAVWIWLTSSRKFMVFTSWQYTFNQGTDLAYTVMIPRGFVFDGASIPRLFWFVLSPVGLLLIPGLLHDYAYKYDRLEIVNIVKEDWVVTNQFGRAHWDRMFRNVAIEVNGFKWINYIAWLSLVVFGWVAWNKHRRAEENA